MTSHYISHDKFIQELEHLDFPCKAKLYDRKVLRHIVHINNHVFVVYNVKINKKRGNLIIIIIAKRTNLTFLSTIKWLTIEKCYLMFHQLKISEWIRLKTSTYCTKCTQIMVNTLYCTIFQNKMHQKLIINIFLIITMETISVRLMYSFKKDVTNKHN